MSDKLAIMTIKNAALRMSDLCPPKRRPEPEFAQVLATNASTSAQELCGQNGTS